MAASGAFICPAGHRVDLSNTYSTIELIEIRRGGCLMNPDVALMERLRDGVVALPADVDSSPIARALGMRVVSLDMDAGTASSEFAPAELFLQGAGVLQGGAVAAMLDFAIMAIVLPAMPAGAIPATTNLDVAYFRPAPAGRYRAVARIRRATRALTFIEASLWSFTGEEIAAATSTVAIKSGHQATRLS